MDERARADAVAEMDEAWEAAVACGAQLERSMARLGRALEGMADLGAHVMMRFPHELTQEWWVVFSERGGNMIPRSPEEAPIPAIPVNT